jgi:hypothetical protein
VETGAVQETITIPLPRVAITFAGGRGTALGIILLELAEKEPMPTSLTLVSRNK